MIRRDYILRMLEEFFEVLSRIRALQKDQKWNEASQLLDTQFEKLVKAGAPAIAQMTETELLARLLEGEPTLVVREKTLILATLLKEAGDSASAQEHSELGRSCYVRGLNLLLGVLSREEVSECPAFVPRVEGFLSALGASPLPLSTQAMLMQHYERIGEFAKAEDALFTMLEEQPDNLDLLNFGITFYRRLQSQSDTALTDGNLPRPEVEAGLTQLAARRSAQSEKQPVAPLNRPA